MKYSVPENIGGELRKLEGVANAEISDLIFGTSQANKPKMTVKYVITDEMEGLGDDEPSAVGENVLETYSLQPQALWKVNDLYKMCTGERIPQGDHDKEEFEGMLIDALVGKQFSLVLQLGTNQQGEERTEVASKALIG